MLILEELSNLENLGNINIPDLEKAATLLKKNGLLKLASILDDLIDKKNLIDIESEKVTRLHDSEVMSVFDKAQQ